jgi:hypothetical protein
VRGAAVEAVAVSSVQDRAFVAFADGQVDGARRSWDERDGGGFVAFADDAKGAVTALDSEVFDVGGTRFADTEAIESKEHGEGGMVAVEAFGGEQEHAELGAVETACVVGMELGASDVLGRVGVDAAVEVRESIEPAHSGEATVHRRRGEATLFHPRSVQLDLRARRS